MTPSRPLISVVFSFRNEAQNLRVLVERLARMFSAEPVDYELIFVDDDSTDDSAAILKEIRVANSAVKTLRLSRRFGVAEGVRAGLDASRGDAVIYMDTDLQDPPEVIPALLAAWRDGAEVVHTVRSRREGESWLKMRLTGLAYRLIRFGSTIALPVDAGDFKLLSRRAVGHLLALGESDPYLRGLVVWLGFRQVFVPYVREARHGGRTHFPFFSRNPWKTVVLGLTSFSFAPVYVTAVAAAGGLALSIGTIGAALWLATSSSPHATVVAFIGLATFFWATTLAAVAGVGLYVIRIYKDVRGRPQYLVASREGWDETARPPAP